MKNNYDRIELRVPKGKKNPLQLHAATRGESLNAFVNRAIDEAVERDDRNNVLVLVQDDVTRRRLEAMRRFIEENDNCDEPIPEFERATFREVEI